MKPDRRNRILTIVGLSTLWSILQSAITYPLPLMDVFVDLTSPQIATFHTVYSVILVITCGMLLNIRKQSSLRGNLGTRGRFLVFGALGSAGSALLVLNTNDPSQTVLILIGIGFVLFAFSIVTLVVGWGEQTANLSQKTLPFDVIFSFGLHVGYSILFILSGLPIFWAWVAYPLISGACLAMASRPTARQNISGFRPLAALPWTILVPCCLFVFFGIVLTRLLAGTGMRPTAGNEARLVALLVSVVAMAGVFLIYRKSKESNVRFSAFSYLATVFVAAFLVAIIVVDNGLPYGTRVIIGVEHCLEVFIWIILATAVKEKGLSPSVVFTLFLLVIVALPQFVATDLTQATGVVEYISANMAATTLAALSAFIAFVVAMLLVLFNVNRTVNKANKSNQDFEKLALDKASKLGGLSAREYEMMVLLYKNHSPQAIADELVIAKSTVNSHIKHMYMKLSVHSRLELVNLIDTYKADL